MKKEKIKNGFEIYTAPHAERIEMFNEGLLCASPSEVDGGLEGFGITLGDWGDKDFPKN